MAGSKNVDTRPEEPSAYVFKWGVYSWVCVAVGIAFAVMWAMVSPILPGIVIGALIAVVGGILFALTPRAALAQKPTPMTPEARAKAAEARRTHQRPDGSGDA